MTPRQAEQRSEPAGPRSRVPGGIAKGGLGKQPPLARREGESLTRQQLSAGNGQTKGKITLKLPTKQQKTRITAGFSCLPRSHTHRFNPDPGAMQVERKGRPSHQTDHDHHRIHHRLTLAVADTGSAVALA